MPNGLLQSATLRLANDDGRKKHAGWSKMNKMRVYVIAVVAILSVVLTAGALLAACTPHEKLSEVVPDSQVQSRAQAVSVPDGVAEYTDVTVMLEDTPLELFRVMVNPSQRWQANAPDRIPSGVGYFSLEGKVNVRVTFPFAVTSASVVRPLSAQVEVRAEQNTLSFVLSSSGNYVVEPCREGDIEPDFRMAIHLFVSSFDEPTSSTDNVIIFQKGLHSSANDARISSNNEIVLGSNTTVVLEEGAVVQARFVANHAQNISLCGRGIIDGSAFVRNANTGQVTVPLDFNYCTNVRLSDFSVLDPAGWCVNFYFDEHCTIDNIKIISSRSNGDGISLQSCTDVEVSDCFVRSWDDSLVVKNYPEWSDRSKEGATRNIVFRNCTLWTDLAQSMEIGYETVGEQLSDVTFKDITVLHNYHKPVVSIHNGNNARIRNILFDGITVESALMGRGDAGSNNQLVEIANLYSATWSDQHKVTPLGSIEGVTVRNLTVLDGNLLLPIDIRGCTDVRSAYRGSVHRVNDVELVNVWIKGKPLTEDYEQLRCNQYASVVVQVGESAYTVPFVADKTADELSRYTDVALVTFG